jgi:plastocyanin
MRSVLRPVFFVPVFALALAVGALWMDGAAAVDAATPTVTMYDNDGPTPNQGIDEATGYWGFAPAHIEVSKGTMVLFNNPASNKRPHTATDIARTGGSFENNLVAGGKFDSSPTQEALVTVGNSWTLDTSGLSAGHYAYYCRLHPWMVGSITVTGE